MPDTGKDSPIWIVTRGIQRHHRIQYSEIDSEIFINPHASPAVSVPVDVTIKVEPADAIVDAPKTVTVTSTTTGTPVRLQSTPHVGRLNIRLEATATWKDGNGGTQTAKQIRYIELPG
jgi:hypothetical protein